ncbi:MAG: hypothetical protein M1814_003701 [Vezdaea aestivalis]|nr:MAG: hypothetical protein M1814_003701 [Vezdaea aestivalis]
MVFSIGLRSCRGPVRCSQLRQSLQGRCSPSPSEAPSTPFLRYQSSSSASASSPLPRPSPPHRSGPGRFFRFVGLSLFFTTSGYLLASTPPYDAVKHFFRPPTDAEALKTYLGTAPTSITHEIDTFISAHPLVRDLRANPAFKESRPHLQIPPNQRLHNLTGGVLAGPGKIVAPPYIWLEAGGKSAVCVCYIGGDVCGHVGVIHGGLLATLLDEGMARACFAALPNKLGMTANLNIDYRKPAPAGSFLVLKATTTKVEGRKAWVEGRIETLVKDGETPVLVAEAKALYVEPRNAKRNKKASFNPTWLFFGFAEAALSERRKFPPTDFTAEDCLFFVIKPKSGPFKSKASKIMASREQYEVPTGGSAYGQTGGYGANNFQASTLDQTGPSVTYLCGDCNAKVALKRGDPVRCKECGHRVLYKQRTKR